MYLESFGLEFWFTVLSHWAHIIAALPRQKGLYAVVGSKTKK
jgi:hypothetical protein